MTQATVFHQLRSRTITVLLLLLLFVLLLFLLLALLLFLFSPPPPPQATDRITIRDRSNAPIRRLNRAALLIRPPLSARRTGEVRVHCSPVSDAEFPTRDYKARLLACGFSCVKAALSFYCTMLSLAQAPVQCFVTRPLYVFSLCCVNPRARVPLRVRLGRLSTGLRLHEGRREHHDRDSCLPRDYRI